MRGELKTHVKHVFWKDTVVKKIVLVLLGSALAFGVAACGPAKTSADAPSTVDGKADDPAAPGQSLGDANSEVRQDQLDSDIRAREQRNDIAGDETVRADGDLESEVRSKLEANIPRAKLAVSAKDGVVTIGGTVSDEREFKTIEPLAKEIEGVKSVNMDEVKVVPPAG